VKVLVLSSGNNGGITSFVQEQGNALRKKGVEINYFLVKGKGYYGYLQNLSELNRKISEYKPDLLHAHYGLTALLANLQRKVPVISTFHGSDIWVFRKNRIFSQFAHILSKQSIIVDPKMAEKLTSPGKSTVIPCGVEIDTFYEVEKELALQIMNLSQKKINILFSSKFDYYEKNYPLAQKIMHLLGDDFDLIELIGYSRSQVNLLFNACDVALMTSFSEGSPQFIKEAMLCNCPIVSTNVGDISEVIGKTNGCYVTSFDPAEIIEKIRLAVAYRKENGFTNGRERIIELGLDSETIAGKVIEVYKKVLSINN
jgi:teichuronic acid biosynthesis glycosyltransferase TuaC